MSTNELYLSHEISKPLSDWHATTPPASELDLAKLGYADISPNKDGGVMKLVKQKGVGTDFPISGDTVFIKYFVSLASCTPFGDCRCVKDKLTFVLGKGKKG
jgi:hypothetical protein